MAQSKPLTNDPNALSQIQREEIGALFDKMVPTAKPCEVCGSTKWTMNDRLVTPAMLTLDIEEKTFKHDLTTVHPCLFLQCAICGNSKFLSLIRIGYNPFASGEK